MDDRWLPVPGYEGLYEVSDHGRVRSLDRFNSRGRWTSGRELKNRPLPNGRPRVSLSRNGEIVDAYPYTLVLLAFVGPRPPKHDACHWDDNPNNNHLSNLRWGTRTENMQDMARNGSGNAGLTHCPLGHPYDAENTYIYPGARAHRGCRACGRVHGARKRQLARDRAKQLKENQP